MTGYQTDHENQRVYDLIWSQMPEMQNRHSSSWWYFLLFPRSGKEYGPRQLMFVIANRVGDRVRVNGEWLPGIDLQRSIEDGVDGFHAMSVGWYGDSQGIDGYLLKQASPVVLSARQQFIHSWTDADKKSGYGMEIRRSTNRPLALETIMRGPNGSAHFEAWGDLDGKHASPQESLHVDTPFGGTHYIAWRRMNFEGEFTLPAGREKLSGLCYFQRPCLNVPLFPWKWLSVLFPGGAMFSAYVPYVGLNLFRKGYQFFSRERMEQFTLPIGGSAYWDWPAAPEEIRFNKARITPLLNNGAYPQFQVQAGNDQGDYLAFRAGPYGHTHFYMDRPVLGNRLESQWTYNEYLFRVAELRGSVSGKEINEQTMGQGFGNLEYTWGLGL